MSDNENSRVLKKLAHYLWPKNRFDLKVRVVLAFAFMLGEKGVNVAIPFALKRAVDSLTPVAGSGLQLGANLTLGLVLAYAAARVMTQIFGEAQDYVFSNVTQHTQRLVARETFEHLHSLSLSFHLDRQTGGLSRAIERGTRGIQTVLQFMLFNILPILLEVFMVSGILWWKFGWPVAAVTLITICGYIVYTLTVTEWRVKFRKTMNQRDSEASTKAIDSLLNFETVKYFGNENHEARRYDVALAGYERAAVQSQRSLSLLNVGQGFIIALGLVGVMGLAAYGVMSGRMTVGDFVLVNTYLIQLYSPLNLLGFVYRETKQSLIDMDKMFELLEVPRTVEDRNDASTLTVADGEIVFENVVFGYNPDRTILRGVSFRVMPGKTVAIVGPSGAGKSTISRLLFRFYDVNSGSIRIDGQDVRTVTQESLRHAIGIVPQDTVLFNDTIGYNVRYGRVDATEDDVLRAAKLAQINGFIERLPAGFETVVGERGLKLSGGEKQRVAIARTILKDPKVLLLDEATSALDSLTEKEILSSLREISKNRTTLTIAHRLSTVVDADEILVLKDGNIVERGRHEQLLALGGEYSVMWARQAEAQRAEATLREVNELL